MDLNKVSPAPWFYTGMDLLDNNGKEVTDICVVNDEDKWICQMIQKGEGEEDAYFIALARNAFDVMMRRHWTPCVYGSKFGVVADNAPNSLPTRLIHMRWDDPFTALVEADNWYKENMENKAT